MRWQDFRSSENVEDRRGGSGGGGMGLPGGAGGPWTHLLKTDDDCYVRV